MAVKAISYSYWRRIKAGTREISSVPASVREDVITLAKIDVADGIITPEEYTEFTGEIYEVVVEETPKESVEE